MNQLPAPFVPADADLRDFAYTPIFRSRLFGSAFHARVSDSEWRAGVTLWLKSWEQTPAGSLPNDDIELCRLAELGRDMKSWKKIKNGALHGWVKCNDGRLYHKVVAQSVLEALDRKLRHRWKNECGRIKKANQRNKTNLPYPSYEEWLSTATSGGVLNSVPGDTNNCPEGQSGVVPKDIDSCPANVSVLVPQMSSSKGREGKGIEGIGSKNQEAYQEEEGQWPN